MEIRNFQDDKLNLLIKKLGYPFAISKTKFTTLGTSHQMTQSLHLIAWLAKQSIELNNIPEEKMPDDLPGQNQYYRSKMYEKQMKGEPDFQQEYQDFLVQKEIEYREKMGRGINEISQLNQKLEAIRKQTPPIEEFEQQLYTLNEDNQNAQQIIDNSKSGIMHLNSQIQYEDEQSFAIQQKSLKLEQKLIEITQLIQNQAINNEQANKFKQKIQHNYQTINILLDQEQQIEEEIKNDNERKMQFLKKIEESIAQYNQMGQSMNKIFNDYHLEKAIQILDKIPIECIIRNEQKDDDLDLFDFNDMEDASPRKKQQRKKSLKRRSIQIYEAVQKRDPKELIQLIIPYKKIKGHFSNFKVSQQEQIHTQSDKNNILQQELQVQKSKYYQGESEENSLKQKINDKGIKLNQFKVDLKKSFDQNQRFQEVQTAINQTLNEINIADQQLENLNKKVYEEHSQAELNQESLNDLIFETEKYENLCQEWMEQQRILFQEQIVQIMTEQTNKEKRQNKKV